MPLLNNTKGNYSLGYDEDTMQEAVKEWLLKYPFLTSNDGYLEKAKPPKIYREIHVPEIGRRSDLIVFFSKRKIFNIECKLFDGGGVIKQAKDHLAWADYSYICFPHNVYLPNYQRTLMLKHGIGLLYWIPGFGLIEGIMANYNENSKKDKLIRQNLMNSLRIYDLKKIGRAHV